MMRTLKVRTATALQGRTNQSGIVEVMTQRGKMITRGAQSGVIQKDCE
jgi:hypothetical protein